MKFNLLTVLSSIVILTGLFSLSAADREDLLKGPWGETEQLREEKDIDITYDSLGKQFGVAVLIMYQKMISPQLNTNCQFYPSCSNYAKQAVLKHGFFQGYVMGIERFIRCNRWAKEQPYEIIKTASGYRRKDLPEDNLLKKD